MQKTDFWQELENKYGSRQINFIGGEWLPCYFAYKDDPAKLRASMKQVFDMVEHRHSKYVIDKLYAAKKALGKKCIGYCSQWMDRAFSINHNPQDIEDEKVREFVADNLGWFENLVVAEEGFDEGLNKLMRAKAGYEKRKFIFDGKMVEELKKKREINWE